MLIWKQISKKSIKIYKHNHKTNRKWIHIKHLKIKDIKVWVLKNKLIFNLIFQVIITIKCLDKIIRNSKKEIV